MNQYRQGDVLIVRVPKIPVTATEEITREQGRIVLAHGELTGHAHAIKSERATLFRDLDLGAIFLCVMGDEPALLEHEEHAAIALEPGDYRVTRQREYDPYDPSDMRTVMD